MRTMNQEKVERLADFINQYARDNNGSSPSLSEIMEYMSMSRSTAYRYILELEKRGLVSYSGKNTLQTELQRKMRCGFKKIRINWTFRSEDRKGKDNQRSISLLNRAKFIRRYHL